MYKNICIKKLENQLVGVLIFEKSQIARFIFFVFVSIFFFFFLNQITTDAAINEFEIEKIFFILEIFNFLSFEHFDIF